MPHQKQYHSLFICLNITIIFTSEIEVSASSGMIKRNTEPHFNNQWKYLFLGVTAKRWRDYTVLMAYTSTLLELKMYPMNSLRNTINFLNLVLIAALLTACSGGGSKSPTPTPPPANTGSLPAQPTLALGYGTNQFNFTWGAINNATYYQLLENPDGASGYTQIGADLTTTTYDHAIALPQRVNASYLLKACNSEGCTSSTEIFVSASVVAAVGYVKASNTEAGDTFGYAVALSGDGTTLAIGTAGPNPTPGPNPDSNPEDTPPIKNLIPGAGKDGSAGAVYLFSHSGGVWVQQQYIKATNAESNDYFGWSLALSHDGNTLAVGAPGESSDATGIDGGQNNNNALQSGAVYVYNRNNSSWAPPSYIKASNTGASDFFGWSVALSADGNTLAVGAYGEDSNAKGVGVDDKQSNNSHSLAGAAYVYSRNTNIWTQQAYLKASNTDGASANTNFGADYFGWSLDLSSDGNTLAVGAFGEDGSATGINGDQNNNLAPNSGAVHTFSRTDITWTPQAYIKASNTNTSDKFGISVKLSGNGTTLAVGAPNEDSNAINVGGSQSDNSTAESGAVYIFNFSSGSWAQQGYIKASNTGTGDWFGMTTALSEDGNTLVVGAPYEASNGSGINGDPNDNSAAYSGAIYHYTRSNGLWSDPLYAKAPNAEANDSFGRSLDLNADATRIAVSAPYESSSATGIGGNQSNNDAARAGAVYLY